MAKAARIQHLEEVWSPDGPLLKSLTAALLAPVPGAVRPPLGQAPRPARAPTSNLKSMLGAAEDAAQKIIDFVDIVRGDPDFEPETLEDNDDAELEEGV